MSKLSVAGLIVVSSALFFYAGMRLAQADDDALDAVAAAPDSHVVLLENDTVRVLEVIIRPGEKEPMHTHRWPSVMIVDGVARIRYYNENDEAVYETPAGRPEPDGLDPEWMDPEGLHAVENIDAKAFHAIRVEIKSE